MKHSRSVPTFSLLEQICMEGDIEVHAYADHNDMMQVFKHELLAIGCGTVNEVHAAPYDMNMDLVNSTIQSPANKKYGSKTTIVSPTHEHDDNTNNKTKNSKTNKNNTKKGGNAGVAPMGFAVALTEDLLRGTTSACATYDCPNLMNGSCSIGSVFEVLNLEAWTFTPCVTEEQAERNELNIAFRDDHSA